MSLLQKIAVGYFVVLLAAASLNYVPGITDDQGLAFGIFIALKRSWLGW